MVLFTHDVRKTKGAAYKNGLKNAKCKRSLIAVAIALDPAYNEFGWNEHPVAMSRFFFAPQ